MNEHFEAADLPVAAGDSVPFRNDRELTAGNTSSPDVEHQPAAPRNVIATFAGILQRMEPNEEFPALHPDTRMEELGIDSVATMEILGCLEDEFDVVIPDEVLMSIRTVGDVQRAIDPSAQMPGSPDR